MRSSPPWVITKWPIVSPKSVLTDTLSDLKASVRKAYEHIRKLAQEDGGVRFRRDIRQALQLPDSTVRRWLDELVELDYLEAEVKRARARPPVTVSPIEDRARSSFWAFSLRRSSEHSFENDSENFATSPNIATGGGDV